MPTSWKTLIVRHLRPKCHVTEKMTFRWYVTFFRDQMCLNKAGEQYPLCLWGLKCNMLLCGYGTNDPTGCQREVCAWYEGRGQPRSSFGLLFSGPQENNSTLQLQKPAASKSFCPLASSSYLGKDSRIQCPLARVPHFKFKRCQTKPDFTLTLRCQWRTTPFMVFSATCKWHFTVL
jgi:hypothetical protein